MVSSLPRGQNAATREVSLVSHEVGHPCVITWGQFNSKEYHCERGRLHQPFHNKMLEKVGRFRLLCGSETASLPRVRHVMRARRASARMTGGD